MVFTIDHSNPSPCPPLVGSILTLCSLPSLSLILNSKFYLFIAISQLVQQSLDNPIYTFLFSLLLGSCLLLK